MICRLLDSGSLEANEMWHGLDECRNRRKRDFSAPKKATVEEGRKGGLVKFKHSFSYHVRSGRHWSNGPGDSLLSSLLGWPGWDQNGKCME